jgi:hypothetical protein
MNLNSKIYTYKNKEYELLYDDLEIKDSGTREWKQGVMYKQIESGLLFVRDKEGFFERFKVVKG